MKDKDSCENCRYSYLQGELMFCRRYPPTRAVGSYTDEYKYIVWQSTTFFPEVEPCWWCGEFKASNPSGANLAKLLDS